MKRTAFLHYHIYKNAGTSIDRVFEKVFGPTVYLEALDPDDSLTDGSLLKLLSERPDVAYISSHALKPPRPIVPGWYLVDIIFLRHPIDRFRSIYDFSRSNLSRSGPTELAARRYSLRDFSAWMANETPWNFFDPQTTILGNAGDFFHPPSEVVLQDAMRYALQARMLGTVELFAESFAAAVHCLRGVRPDLELDPLIEPFNATQSGQSTLQGRVAFVRQSLGQHLYERLTEALSLDLRLWQAVTAEVVRRHGLCIGWNPTASPSSVRSIERVTA